MTKRLSKSIGPRLLSAACCVLLVLAGCPKPESTSDESVKKTPLAGAKLRLLVVDDPELATAVGKLRGEWTAQSGAELVVAESTEGELLKKDSIDADAVICASHLLGPLAEGQRIAPIPKESLQASEVRWSQIFDLARDREAVWGTATFAVPLGSPVLTCYYRADMLEKLGRQPPRTWAEYQQLAELLSDREKLGNLAPPKDAPWSGAIEPLAPGWAGLVFLARAASAAKHPDNYSTLFNIETMAPLVNSPPMVRSLVELVAAAKLGPAEQLTYGPAEVRNAFWQGRGGLALTWPTAAAKLPKDVVKDLAVGVAELPGAVEVYNIDERSWDPRPADEPSRVPLLATAGRIGVIGRHSEYPEGVATLLLWLSGSDLNPPPSARSPQTTLFRQSHLKAPQTWVESTMSPATASAYADLTEATLRREQAVFALRIPGRAEYLAALDEAVRDAVTGKKPPATALSDAASRWSEITKKLGLQQQRVAYLHGLGLEP